ncbi:ribosome-recycling factor, mitochondrial [Yarrowia lipolytica]|jgi:ribosome recycling factor|uniref:Ribosome-recycling factor, mitochondrial n=2 Tax=Yarrowia lipolytica TaxID=4952 RepID=RRF1_YARLI|nr:YALI0A10813p [Yarrowia lipolytica CLIB122]Q6CHA2.1 RecName: Full=Ribosome-recycling factor, mitochondrial; Short=RRF; AltName: Full=Ribosome-releasing factor, mitochondrial; Flags: Precursor [Yarrowia lipolytica CLIB122]AOW00503.1 hypothetical protein YALI1_A10907g [Yarrowia lipolytica]KAB8282970.1 ribosome-recycling factor, mitochondrial [Yarrowia lipolytica]KAE8168802.1 ribosome-recycling factor, mitochondrial [Yarrowia lipolytica]KAJ8051566.1 ribosome-recycling factor, mitochondrial [Yar|eukprot:XP_499960.1 YALI0A10813p [Yarrowia lipolytica CLIB122]
MFLRTVRSQAVRAAALHHTVAPALCMRPVLRTQTVAFSSTPVTLGKKKKGGKEPKAAAKAAAEEAVDEDLFMIEWNKFEDLSAKSVAAFAAKAKEIKAGNNSPDLINNIEVKISKDEVYQIKDIASVALKGGRTLSISVYDPSHTKQVTASILASDLNMNPQPQANSPQILNIPLPPPSAESRAEQQKELKALYNAFKADKKLTSGLAAIRDAFKKDHKKMADQKSIGKDVVKREDKKFEELQKAWTSKIEKEFKTVSDEIAKK